MTDLSDALRPRVAKAVRHYWTTRLRQQTKQGGATGRKDQGLRAAVTGGAQMNGFITLLAELLAEGGLRGAEVFTGKSTTLPGFFRPVKDWDLVAVADGRLVACVEVKSHAGPSYGNNFNNRVEEAIGNAVDFWKAYEQGAFAPSPRPFLGYIMLLEHDPASTRPVRAKEPHFPVLPEFVDASYARRYGLFCEKLLRERLYDGCAFLMASREEGRRGAFSEPAGDLSAATFAAALMGRAFAFSKGR